MKPKKLLQKINQQNYQNIDFADFVSLVEAVGFRKLRQRGSHRVYIHPKIEKILNLQPSSNGDAKPYQVRQFQDLATMYNLNTEGAK